MKAKTSDTFIRTFKIATVFLLAIGILAQFAHRTPKTQTYTRSQKSTVLLVAKDGGQGSGVVIRRENALGSRLFVWTAAHVVSGSPEMEVKQFIRIGTRKAGSVSLGANVIAQSPGGDMALLWLDADADYFPGSHLSTEPAPVGTPVYHVGNFLGADFDDSISTGVISQIGVMPSMFGWPWPVSDQMVGAACPGSSGGPVFRADNNEVLGLVVGAPGRGSLGFVCYVPVRAMNAWAEEAGMQWAIRGTRCPDDKTLRELVKLTHLFMMPSPTPVILPPALPPAKTNTQPRRKF
jgi:S1-C subfamily serine protease